jgi:hypothetical protein
VNLFSFVIFALLINIEKTAHANRYRFHKRLIYKTLSYPPNLYGVTEYEVSAKNEENEYIKKLLQIKQHPEEPLFPDEYSLNGPPKGRIYEKQPFKFRVESGKTYSICTCGYSNNQVIYIYIYIYLFIYLFIDIIFFGF